YFADQGQWDRAEPLIDSIVDVREDQGEGSPDLPTGLLLWSRLLFVRADYKGVVSVSARAARLYQQQTPPEVAGFATAIHSQAWGLLQLSNFKDAEPLMRHALAIDE